MNAEKASHTVELLNPDSAHSMARTGALKPGLDNSAAPNKVQGANTATTVTPINPIADPGKASKINPSTTAVKMAKKCHAFCGKPEGGGIRAMMIATISGVQILTVLGIIL
jgi:hypothetical protein